MLERGSVYRTGRPGFLLVLLSISCRESSFNEYYPVALVEELNQHHSDNINSLAVIFPKGIITEDKEFILNPHSAKWILYPSDLDIVSKVDESHMPFFKSVHIGYPRWGTRLIRKWNTNAW